MIKKTREPSEVTKELLFSSANTQTIQYSNTQKKP